MKAIVLSFDKHHVYCELLYRMYMKLWPDCPFTFRIPWNQKKPKFFCDKTNVELIECDQDIRLTVLSLLKDIDDNDFVYWCIDDRFPIYINKEKISQLYMQINLFKNYSYIKPFHNEEVPNEELTFNGFLEQSKLHQWGYYMHHFCKSGILKSLFSQKNCHSIDDFHELLINSFYKNTIGLRLLSEQEDYIKFEEPCIDGNRTQAAKKYLKILNINDKS